MSPRSANRLLVLDAKMHVVLANSAFYRTFQVTPDATLGRLLHELGNRQWDIPALRTLLKKVLSHNTVFNDFEVTHHFETRGQRTLRLNARRIFGEPGRDELILLAIEESPDSHSRNGRTPTPTPAAA